MMLPTQRKTILTVVRPIDPSIIDTIAEQNWHRLQVNDTELKRHGAQAGSPQLIQVKIKTRPTYVKLTCILQWLLSLTVLEIILANPLKRTVWVKIIVTNLGRNVGRIGDFE